MNSIAYVVYLVYIIDRIDVLTPTFVLCCLLFLPHVNLASESETFFYSQQICSAVSFTSAAMCTSSTQAHLPNV